MIQGSWQLDLALLLLLALGAWRYQLKPLAACPGPSDLASYQDPDGTFAVVEGVVTGYPDVRDTQTYYRPEADRLTLANQPHVVHGVVLAQLPSEPAFRYGDRLRAAGMLEAPATLRTSTTRHTWPGRAFIACCVVPGPSALLPIELHPSTPRCIGCATPGAR